MQSLVIIILFTLTCNALFIQNVFLLSTYYVTSTVLVTIMTVSDMVPALRWLMF